MFAICCSAVFQVNPSLLANCGDGVVPAEGVLAAAGDASNCVVPPYLVELVQTTVRDEVEEAAEKLHGDVVRMHVDMLVQVDSVRVRTRTYLQSSAMLAQHMLWPCVCHLPPI